MSSARSAPRKARIAVSTISVLLGCFFLLGQLVVPHGTPRSVPVAIVALICLGLIALGGWIYPKPIIWLTVLKIYIGCFVASLVACWIIAEPATR
jgi:hypothetical protein